LTDAQLVGQLFVADVYGSGPTQVTAAQRAANLALYQEPTPAAIVKRWHLGGVILIDRNTLDPARASLHSGNVASAAQIKRLTSGLQAAAHADTGVPLLIATDQEGGTVQRIRDGVTLLPSEAKLAETLPASQLTCTYNRLGRQLRALGVNQDYAPVADVIRGPGGVIGSRSFGKDPAVDARDVVAAVKGLQAAGVLATLKHWPGHGGTTTDSHQALGVLHESVSTWRRVDRVPFAAAKDRAAAVLTGFLALPAVDPSGRPAVLSPVLVNGLLRHDLGFRGLIVTDSLWMEPARAVGRPATAALAALRAGNSMLLMSPDLPAASRAVLAKVRSDPAMRRLVQQAVQHVLAAKSRLRTTEELAACP
jgi:beta-N-acetylhexosaminidase